MGFVKYEQDGFVGVITINRPEALNALNTEVIQDLDAVLDSIDLGTTRVLVVTGAGEKSFVAGADIAAMSTMTVQEAREFSKAGNDVFRKLETLPIPSIAAVNGFALGACNELRYPLLLRKRYIRTAGGWSWYYSGIRRNPASRKTDRNRKGKGNGICRCQYQS